MVAPAIVAAGITAAAALANQKQASSAASSATKQGRQFQLDMYERQFADQGKEYITRAKYAKEAGLHPLFALGTSPGFSPVFPGQSSSGSYVGDGIARAGEAVGQGILNAAQDKRNQELHDLTVLKARQELAAGELRLQQMASELARSQQAVNAGPRMTPEGAVVIPAPSATLSPGTELVPLPQHRPTRQEPNVNAPLMTTLIGRDGERIRVISEAGQADELNQVLIAAQGSWIAAKKLAQAAGLDFIWNAGRQAYTLVRRAGRRSSQGEIHRKGRRSQGYRPAVPLP